MTKLIPLTQGQFAQVDDSRFDELAAYSWFAICNYHMFYAARWVTLAGRRKMLYMHHAIIGKPQPGYVTDHKDRNGLNNQNHNLHQVTHAINAMNNGTTGVSWCLARNKWLAQIQIGGVKFNLGRFDDEGAAITARETFKQTYLYDPPPY